MRANDIRADSPLRFGTYLCIAGTHAELGGAGALEVDEVVQHHGFASEFDARGGEPVEGAAFLRCERVAAGQLADPLLQRAEVVLHLASPDRTRLESLCSKLLALLEPVAPVRRLSGCIRPPQFTGNAMHNFAYAHRVVQQQGLLMPYVFLLPLRKTEAWWAKSWMERHTFFLPRYTESGAMEHEGHALAAAEGIAHLMRRTYRAEREPAAEGEYDFVNHFECAAEGVPVFHRVMAALRDTGRNPEWRYVREGPLWQGLRAASWRALFT